MQGRMALMWDSILLAGSSGGSGVAVATGIVPAALCEVSRHGADVDRQHTE